MADCPHKTPMKLFIIRQHKGGKGLPSYAGYFICPDCADYLCTGWCEKEEVWDEDTELYSMQSIAQEKGSVAMGLKPIDIFLSWIKADLLNSQPHFEKDSEVLPP